MTSCTAKRSKIQGGKNKNKKRSVIKRRTGGTKSSSTRTSICPKVPVDQCRHPCKLYSRKGKAHCKTKYPKNTVACKKKSSKKAPKKGSKKIPKKSSKPAILPESEVSEKVKESVEESIKKEIPAQDTAPETSQTPAQDDAVQQDTVPETSQTPAQDDAVQQDTASETSQPPVQDDAVQQDTAPQPPTQTFDPVKDMLNSFTGQNKQQND